MILRPNETKKPKIILTTSNVPGSKMVNPKGKIRFLLTACQEWNRRPGNKGKQVLLFKAMKWKDYVIY